MWVVGSGLFSHHVLARLEAEAEVGVEEGRWKWSVAGVRIVYELKEQEMSYEMGGREMSCETGGREMSYEWGEGGNASVGEVETIVPEQL